MKRTFLGREKPLLTAMLYGRTAQDVMREIVDSISDGAEAFGLQLNELSREYHTPEYYRAFVEMAGNRPIYCTNYRMNGMNNKNTINQGYTEEELLTECLTAIDCGVKLIDITADAFEPSKDQITYNADAIARQKVFIDEAKKRGGEVLMSSHIFHFLPESEVLKIAKEQERRGVDIVKIVTQSNTEEELLLNLKTTAVLRRELKIPFLFLSNGKYSKMHRLIGGMFGSCMTLCVPYYQYTTFYGQPTLKNAKAVIDNFNWGFFEEK